jgi:16S rRNA processing protein RimM
MAKPEPVHLLLMGEFGRAQGLKGDVRLKSFTAHPADIAIYGPLQDGKGRIYELSHVRPIGSATSDMLIARVIGITSREQAEALNHIKLFIPRSVLPPPEDDEFFYADLTGLSVENEIGEVIGRVVQVHNYGAGDMLEITPLNGSSTAFLPFTKALIPIIDLENQRVVMAGTDDLFATPSPDEETQ